jgi:hypothetical protein
MFCGTAGQALSPHCFEERNSLEFYFWATPFAKGLVLVGLSEACGSQGKAAWAPKQASLEFANLS